MAEHTGVSKSTEQRWLDLFDVHPHRQRHFKLSNDPSWLNQVERWFGVITQRAIRRRSFSSVKQLRDKINRFVDDYKSTIRPFVWIANADSIIAKIERLGTLISGTAH